MPIFLELYLLILIFEENEGLERETDKELVGQEGDLAWTYTLDPLDRFIPYNYSLKHNVVKNSERPKVEWQLPGAWRGQTRKLFTDIQCQFGKMRNFRKKMRE
jgi:hypothetical protein